MTANSPDDLDLERVRGDDFPFTLIIKVGGVALNITSFTFLLTVDTRRDPPDTTTQVFQATGVITDGPNGKVTFSLTAPQAATLAGVYYWDLQGTDGAAKKRTYAKGKYTVIQDITK